MERGALTDARACIALIGALLVQVPSSAGAQARAVYLASPACPVAWWDPGAITFALRVELQALGIEVTAGPPAAEIVAHAEDCADPDSPIVIALDAPWASFRQPVVLADIEPELRSRALALAIASALREGARMPDPPPPAPAPPAPIVVEPPPPVPVARNVRIAVGAALFVLPTANVLGGLHLSIALRPGAELPIWIDAAVFAAGTVIEDALGEVQALWAGGSIGLALEADLDPVRLGLRAGIGAGWAGARGRPSADAGGGTSQSALIVPVELTASASLRVAPSIDIVLALGASVFLAGWQFLAEERPALALRPAAGVAIGGLAFEL